MKKTILIILALLTVMVVTATVQYYGRPDGKTIESREELLGRFPKGENWTILSEQEFDGYILSGIYSDNNKSGIAVFEPLGNGKYRLSSKEWRDSEKIIISGAYINSKWYDLVWFNGAKTDHAIITYTVDGHQKKGIAHQSDKMEIFINPSPNSDYTMNVAYYDSDGNKYE